jgi:hypothetical protein
MTAFSSVVCCHAAQRTNDRRRPPYVIGGRLSSVVCCPSVVLDRSFAWWISPAPHAWDRTIIPGQESTPGRGRRPRPRALKPAPGTVQASDFGPLVVRHRHPLGRRGSSRSPRPALGSQPHATPPRRSLLICLRDPRQILVLMNAVSTRSPRPAQHKENASCALIPISSQVPPARDPRCLLRVPWPSTRAGVSRHF